MNNIKHDVWQESDGKTAVCFSDDSGKECRKLLEPGSKKIHNFYASSHFEAMTIYYNFMGWGKYETQFEVDKQPYNAK